MMEPQLRDIADFLNSRDEVAVAWLYGSRAKGNYRKDSDFDIAVAFLPHKLDDILENRLRPELLAMDLQRKMGIQENGVSIIDINNVPISLAFNAISPNFILVNKDTLKKMTTESVIWSKYEDEQISQESFVHGQ